MNSTIRIALTKGRLEKQTLKLFEEMGWDVSEFADKGRKLLFTIPGQNVEIVLAKSPDVITYVEKGVCDIGIAGKDMLEEYADDLGGGNYFEMIDLGFGRCRFSLITGERIDFYKGHSIKTVASKYTNVARRFFEKKGLQVDILKIEGSVELAPLLGLANGIVDIVETGETLKANGLKVIEDISDISARVIVNPAKMKMKRVRISEILDSVLNTLESIETGVGDE